MDLQYFPYAHMREEQRKILQNLNDNYDDYSNFIIEAPTGTGKSAIAYTLMKNVKTAIVLTSTKYLQNQYEMEFHDILSIKGRGAYECPINNQSCERGPCRVNEDIYKQCKRQCQYMRNLSKLKTCNLIVTNYAAFLSNPLLLDHHYDLMILDECHLIENNILSKMGSNIDINKLNEQFDIFSDADMADIMKLSTLKSGYTANEEALNILLYLLKNKYNKLYNNLPNATENQKYILQDQIESIHKTLQKLNYFLQSKDKDNWVCEPSDNVLYIQPINIEKEFNTLFRRHTDKLICMSGTILNASSFINDLGLNKQDTKCIRVASSFNPKLAPIINIPCGNMNYHNIDNSIPKIVATINHILDKHRGEKGIIHTNNYRITEAIIHNCNNGRLLYNQSKSKFYKLTNEELLNLHAKSPLDTVLVSPSLGIGADLKDDLSRFQIIIKMPFTSLKDKRVAKKMSIDQQWYINEMLKTFIQMCGRSVRDKDDYCITYVLDSSFMRYIRENSKNLTKQFKSRIYGDIKQFNEQEYKDLINNLNKS